MKVLFVMRSTVYVRNFESTLRLLADKGHQIHVVADRHELFDSTDLIGRLAREYPQITHSAPPVAASRDTRVGRELRRALDYLRYLGPEYRDAPKLRRRAEQKAPAFLERGVPKRLMETARGRSILRLALRAVDRTIATDPAIDAFIAEHRPDLVAVTPLVEPGSPQAVYLRSARAQGIPTALCVYSWDNLTNKGLIHDPLDLVTVWNEPMKEEAVRLHGVPARRVVVTGAPAHDHWFTWSPRWSRQDFCERVQLDPAKPYLLYLCSSQFIAPNELPFVQRWIEGIRAASPILADAGVLVRPHPQNAKIWKDADFSSLGNVAIWPRSGGNPVDVDSRSDFYDAIHHSAAVIGLNTSAQIESAIVGRGVFTWLTPEFRDTQEGTLHFRHLREAGGGLLFATTELSEHVAQLEQAIANPATALERCRRFIATFIRPYGFDQAASPRLVTALENAAATRPARSDRTSIWNPIVQPFIAHVRQWIERVDDEPEARVEPDTRAARRERKATEGSRASRKADAGARAHQHYLEARARLERWRDQPSAPTGVQLDGIWTATPDAIGDLRQFSKQISGVLRSRYHGPRADAFRETLERELERLLEKGDGTLLVDEPEELGGFGFTGFGKRYNEETLRFFRVVSLLQDAALIKDLRASRPRKTVWEVGGGWGGLAYQIKSLCPDVTYLISGPADHVLVSSVYLQTMFPAARVRFYDACHADAFWNDWDQVDLAFAPESIAPSLKPPQLDLMLDFAAFERMGSSVIESHVRRAHQLGCRYLFSVYPDSQASEETDVEPVVDRYYWIHPVSTAAGLRKRLALSRGGKHGSVDRTYRLGWRRLRT